MLLGRTALLVIGAYALFSLAVCTVPASLADYFDWHRGLRGDDW